MKILLVTETLVAGGAETFCLRLARKLNEIGFECDLLCLNPDLEEAALISQFRALRILRPRLPALRWLKRIDRLLAAAGSTRSVQRAITVRWARAHLLGEYDSYHTNLLGADRLVMELKRDHPSMKILSTLHGDYRLHECGEGSVGERSSIPQWRRVVSELVRGIDRYVYIADDQRALMVDRLGVSSSKLVRIYNGYEPPVSPSAEPAMGERPFTFIMVARGLPEKGWLVLIEAFRRLGGDCRLLLVGKGEYLQELQNAFGSDPRITFVGFHPNPVELIRAADVFVFPSTYPAESLPTVIIEALHCGVPVIASDVGEIARMLQSPEGQRAGLVLALRDGSVPVNALEAAMRQVMDDQDARAAMAEAARGALLQFDMGRCAAAYAKLYREVLGRAESDALAS